MQKINLLIRFISGRTANLFSPEFDTRAFSGRYMVMKKWRSKMTGLLVLLIVSASLGFSAPVVGQVILYGTSTGFGTGGGLGGPGGPGSGTGQGNRSQFHRIDISTGETIELNGDIGFGGDVNGLAIDSGDVIYAGTGGRGPNPINRVVSPTLLFTIDSMGNASPAIGPLGIEFGPPYSAGMGPGAGNFQQFGSVRKNISGWSFHPFTGELFGMAGRGSQLFIADTETGLATLVGTPCESPAIGAPGGFCRRGNAIAFDDVGINDPVGTLFWANNVEVAELDPNDGSIIGFPVFLDYSVFGPPNDQTAPFRVVAMDYHPVTGDLYTAIQQGQPEMIPPPRSTLAILDPRTGTFTIIGEVNGTGVKLDGIAFTSLEYQPPPECAIALDKRRYTDGDRVIAEVLRLANPGSERVKTEIKIWLHKPDRLPRSIFNLGGFGAIRLPAGLDVDFGPVKIIRRITSRTPRGTYEFSCRLLDPVTGELLWEDRNFFEVEDPSPPPGELNFEEEDWTIQLIDQNPDVYTMFTIVRVSPLTPDEVEDVGGRLVWDETEVELCSDLPGGEFITIRDFGNGFVDIGDGFESNTQGFGCPINAAMESAFNDFGVPREACVSVVVDGVEHEYCAPLNPIP